MVSRQRQLPACVPPSPSFGPFLSSCLLSSGLKRAGHVRDVMAHVAVHLLALNQHVWSVCSPARLSKVVTTSVYCEHSEKLWFCRPTKIKKIHVSDAVRPEQGSTHLVGPQECKYLSTTPLLVCAAAGEPYAPKTFQGPCPVPRACWCISRIRCASGRVGAGPCVSPQTLIRLVVSDLESLLLITSAGMCRWNSSGGESVLKGHEHVPCTLATAHSCCLIHLQKDTAVQFAQTMNDALCLQVTEFSHPPFQVRGSGWGVLPIICCAARACRPVDGEAAEHVVYVILLCR